MKLAAYLRVSTVGQLDGFGLDAQETAVRQWAKAHGHKIVAVHRDSITGTSDAIDRPGLSEALAAVQDGTAEGIVVARLDRLARALHVQEAVLGVVWKAGGNVFAADHGEILMDDPDDPVRTLVRQVLGAIAEFDRASISKRMRDGRASKKSAGKLAAGQHPYGWKSGGRGQDSIPDPAEQAVVARIMEMRSEGATYRAIAERLTDDGVPTRRGGNRWDASAVRLIVLREQERLAA